MIHTCYYTFIPSPLGLLTAISDGENLTNLCLHPAKIPDASLQKNDLPVFVQVEAYLHRYFAGCTDKPNIPIKVTGTEFQMQVWDLLNEIPYGDWTTYGSLAKMMGKPKMSPQAIGQAVGRNPVMILIPCHRVLGSGGTLTGYAGGLKNKQFLLDLEKIEYK